MIIEGDTSQIAQRYRALYLQKHQKRKLPQERTELLETLEYANFLCKLLGSERYVQDGTLDLSMPVGGILSIDETSFHVTSALASIPYTPFYDDRSLRLITSTVTGRLQREPNRLERAAVQLTEEGRIDAFYENMNGRFHIGNWHAPERATAIGINPYRVSVEEILEDFYTPEEVEADETTKENVSARFLFTPYLILAHMRLITD